MTASGAPDRMTVWAIALTAPTFIYATNYLTSTYGRIDSINSMLAELGVELVWVTKLALAIGDNGLLAIFLVTTIAQAVVMFAPGKKSGQSLHCHPALGGSENDDTPLVCQRGVDVVGHCACAARVVGVSSQDQSAVTA